MDFSPATVRARFHQLTGLGEAHHTERQALWDELAAITAGDTELTVLEAKEREADIRARVRELHDLLAPIEAERATCARALGGKTGDPA